MPAGREAVAGIPVRRPGVPGRPYGTAPGVPDAASAGPGQGRDMGRPASLGLGLMILGHTLRIPAVPGKALLRLALSRLRRFSDL